MVLHVNYVSVQTKQEQQNKYNIFLYNEVCLEM